MKIHTIWVKYDDDLVPNVVLAVDEYIMDENPHYWDGEYHDLREQGVLDYPHAYVILEVALDKIEQAFAPKVVAVDSVIEPE